MTSPPLPTEFAAMEKYIKMRAALLELNPNADGTVTYVAPPIVVTPPAP